jgi:hypothetical protein
MKASRRPSMRVETPRQHLLRLAQRSQREASYVESILGGGLPLPLELGFDNLADKIRLAADCLRETRESLQNVLKAPYKPTKW